MHLLKTTSTSNHINKMSTIHSDRLITGRVDFVLKMQTQLNQVGAFYEVYGNLIKIMKGKYHHQYHLFLKGPVGAVLQGVYYANDTLTNIDIGNTLCCIGKFSNSSKTLSIFKLRVVSSLPKNETFSRFQNICNFTLNNNTNK